MSFLLNKRLLLASLVAASSASIAQAQPTQGFTLAPSIGYYKMDKDRSIDNATALSLGLGYQFGNSWAMEFVYVNADSESSLSGNNVDVDQFRLDALYHLTTRGKLTPYLAAGLGTVDFSSGPNNGLINAGLGVKYAFTDMMAIRADYRLINDFEDDEFDQLATLGLHFVLGSQSKKTASTLTNKVKAAPLTTVSEPIPEQQPASEPIPVQQLAPEPVIASEPADDDQDGVPNHLDQCPNTLIGLAVDDKGCYLALTTTSSSIDLNVQFASNSAKVNEEYAAKIEEVAAFLKQHPNTQIIIEGHTDSAGPASYNKALSKKRAQAIADKLITEQGIDKSRISAIGYGPDKPLVGNETAADRKINRRVIAVISLDKNDIPTAE